MKEKTFYLRKLPDGSWAIDPSLKGWALSRHIKGLRYAILRKAQENGWRLTDAGSCTMVHKVEDGVYDLICLSPQVTDRYDAPHNVNYARIYITPELLADESLRKLVYAYGYDRPEDIYTTYGQTTGDQLVAEIAFMQEYSFITPEGNDSVNAPVNALMTLAKMLEIDVFAEDTKFAMDVLPNTLL